MSYNHLPRIVMLVVEIFGVYASAHCEFIENGVARFISGTCAKSPILWQQANHHLAYWCFKSYPVLHVIPLIL